MTWEIGINETRRRDDVQALYGGQQRGGIATPTSSENILIFTDPASGAEFGYDKHEGLLPDGTYRYTGEGQVGDQEFKGGNKAILQSVETGRIIRLFLAKSPNATYVGSFTLGEPAYEMAIAPDRNGMNRQVIVFNLMPMSAALGSLPLFNNASGDETSLDTPWVAPDWATYVVNRKARGERVTEVTRQEHKLQSDFGLWLGAQGHRLIERSLATGSTQIYPDLFDATTMTVFEAKRSSGRGYVRTAIGQVLDYQNVAELNGLKVDCGTLFPGRPDEHMLLLCKKLGIKVFIRGNADFGEPEFLQALPETKGAGNNLAPEGN
jgi:hypothetical protein